MTLRRFLIRPESIQGQEAVIRDPGEIRHISKVLRLKAGEPVILFDGKGKEYRGVISGLARDAISLKVEEALEAAAESALRIILGVALLKPSRFDWLLQKTTELGVSEIVPFYGLGVVPRWKDEQARIKQWRWKKIVAEAAKQSGRARVPVVHSPRPFEESLVPGLGEGAKIFLWENEKNRTLQKALVQPASPIYALIGPEGGFSDEEARKAEQAGFLSVRLGPRILRAETAGIVIASLLQFLLGDLN